MKKTILTMLLIPYCLVVFSQIGKKLNKGTIMVGGNFSGEMHDVNHGFKTNDFDFVANPYIGYFFFNKIVFGLNTNFSYEHYSFGSDIYRFRHSYSLLGCGPFVRFYLRNGIFFTSQVNFSTGKLNDENPYGRFYDSDIKAIDVSFGPGYSLFLNKNIALEASVLYLFKNTKANVYNEYHTDFTDEDGSYYFMYGKSTLTEKQKTNKLYINIGFQIFF